jgi:starvation-inducible DNA-binding protein
MTNLANTLSHNLADTYALYLKTQNYHWHVKGSQFKSFHELFEMQYQLLAEAVDELAERIIILGNKAPATFREFEALTQIKAGNSDNSANQMVTELAKDHNTLAEVLNKSLQMAEENHDEGTIALLSDQIMIHEKARWMLNASRER